MANFFETLGRTNALPQAMRNLSDMAIQMRDIRRQDERTRREQQIFKMKMDEFNRKEAERTRPIQLSAVKSGMPVQSAEMDKLMMKTLREAGYLKSSVGGEVPEFDGENYSSFYIEKQYKTEVLNLLGANMPRYIKAAQIETADKLQEAENKWNETQAKKPYDPKKDKAPPELIAVNELREQQRILNRSREALDEAYRLTQEEKRQKAKAEERRKLDLAAEIAKEKRAEAAKLQEKFIDRQDKMLEARRKAAEKTAETRLREKEEAKKLADWNRQIERLTVGTKKSDLPKTSGAAESMAKFLIKNQSKAKAWKVIREKATETEPARQLVLDKNGGIIKVYRDKPPVDDLFGNPMALRKTFGKPSDDYGPSDKPEGTKTKPHPVTGVVLITRNKRWKVFGGN